MSIAINRSTFDLIKNRIGNLISKEDKLKYEMSYHEFEKLIINKFHDELNSAIVEKIKAEKIKDDEYQSINKSLESAKSNLEHGKKRKHIFIRSHIKINRLRSLKKKVITVEKRMQDFVQSSTYLNFKKNEKKAIEAQETLNTAKNIFENDKYKNELIAYINDARIHFPEPLGNLAYTLLELTMEGGSPREQREDDLKLLRETLNKKDSVAYEALKNEFHEIINDYNNILNKLSVDNKNSNNEKNQQDYDDFVSSMDKMKNKEEYKILSNEFTPQHENSNSSILYRETTDSMASLISAYFNLKGEKEIASVSHTNSIDINKNHNLFTSFQTQ
ncbi:hypothetical protein QVN60_04525 [Yersinia aleksiciae]|uniref:hypothetical protein n=1 Tax=Yersinia aleksiciae TaxID=263819 RepID=UPI0025AAF2A1|nr:hypothetical protein [Yersinia aleksiciae]MDN0122473.1 hypothetical protein [Yersinia aleksiciae]